MTLAEYYGLPEGTNMTLAYSSFYDTVDSDFPCQSNMSNYFYGQPQTCIKKLNVSEVTSFYQTFYLCSNLLTIEDIEDWDVSNVTSMSNMFNNCSSLQVLDISKWNLASLTSMDTFIAACSSLTTLSSITLPPTFTFPSYSGPFNYSNLPKLVNFGGFIGLKSSITSGYGFKVLPNLTYESCINVLNGLYDFVGNGETPNSSQGQLKVHQNFLNLVGDEISIGTNKGWTITA